MGLEIATGNRAPISKLIIHPIRLRVPNIILYAKRFNQ